SPPSYPPAYARSVPPVQSLRRPAGVLESRFEHPWEGGASPDLRKKWWVRRGVGYRSCIDSAFPWNLNPAGVGPGVAYCLDHRGRTAPVTREEGGIEGGLGMEILRLPVSLNTPPPAGSSP